MITMNDCGQAGSYEYKGLSTDTKPTNCAVNSLFLELDTGTFFYFDGTGWIPLKRGGGAEYSLFKSLIDRTVTEVTEEMTKGCATITACAFKDCKNLTKVKLHSDVVKTAYYSFRDCSSLSEVTFPTTGRFDEVGVGAFENCTSLGEINIPSGTYRIGAYAFGHCRSATKLFFPSSLSKIADHAFEWCTLLNNITIPSSITSIEEATFQYCGSGSSYRTELTIPSTVKYIGQWAFFHCSKLVNINIPNGVENLDIHAFEECSSAKTLSLPHTLTNLGDFCFANCSALNTKVTIPSSLSGYMAWHGYSFSGCTSLVEVYIEDGVSRIGDGTFLGCTSLKNINFPGSLGEASNPGNIGAHAFENCTSLEIIMVDTGVRHIGASAFEGCSNLRTVVLPSTISNNTDSLGIGSRAFYYGQNYSKGLNEIKIYATVPPTIGEDAFIIWYATEPGSALPVPYPDIKVPHDSVQAYKNASAWYPYKDRIQSM